MCVPSQQTKEEKEELEEEEEEERERVWGGGRGISTCPMLRRKQIQSYKLESRD